VHAWNSQDVDGCVGCVGWIFGGSGVSAIYPWSGREKGPQCANQSEPGRVDLKADVSSKLIARREGRREEDGGLRCDGWRDCSRQVKVGDLAPRLYHQ
jgi:hypothetical protein